MAFPDLPAMQADLKTLVQLESPSSDPAAVERVLSVISGWGVALGAQVQTLSGGTRCLDFGVSGRNYLLVLAHADTVWPHGTLSQMPWRIEGERLYGPGTYDMKAGIVGLIHALKDLGGVWPAGGIRVLITPDEEIGSASSRLHIESCARQARATLVIEPPVADSHHLKTGRKGVGHFSLGLHGIASHAGNKPQEGASAITAAAEAILAFQALARPELGTTVSVGVIQGGSASNVIPAQARLEIDLRVSTLAEAERLTREAHRWRPSDPRVKFELSGGLNRPPFEQSPATMQLYTQAQQIAAELGFQIGHEVVGGGSDGNFTAPLCPTLDGLGAPGDGAHAVHEHIRLDRWPDHVRLLRGLIAEQ